MLSFSLKNSRYEKIIRNRERNKVNSLKSIPPTGLIISYLPSAFIMVKLITELLTKKNTVENGALLFSILLTSLTIKLYVSISSLFFIFKTKYLA